MSGPATVGVSRLPPAVLAAFPGRQGAECHEQIDPLFPAPTRSCTPAQMVGNAGWIDAGGDFFVYQEGTGPTVGRMIDAVDAERLALARALGRVGQGRGRADPDDGRPERILTDARAGSRSGRPPEQLSPAGRRTRGPPAA